MASTIIKQLTNFAESLHIMPKTVTSAVYTADGEQRLDNIINNTPMMSDDEFEPIDGDATTADATHLGGYAASKYLRKDEITTNEELAAVISKLETRIATLESQVTELKS